MGTLLLQQLLVSPVWFPYTWAIVSLVTFASALPRNGIWPQTPVGSTRSSLGCGTPTTSSHLGLLQFSASSLTIVSGRALSYREGRNGNCTQMGANSWCFNKTLLSASLGEWLIYVHSLPSFSAPMSILEFLWSVVCDLTFHTSFFSGALLRTGIFSYCEFCILLSASCFPNPLLG